MKQLRYLIFAAACLPFFAACDDDDYKEGGGNPVMEVGAIAPVHYGDSLAVDVNCKDNGGVPLSTVKAELYLGQEKVSESKLRTKTEGDYTLKLYVPFYKNLPDGKATLKLTLQNIQVTKSEQNIDIDITRPHFDHLTLVGENGVKTTLMPDKENPFLFKANIPSNGIETYKGYVVAPKAGANGSEITFGTNDDNDVVTGSTKSIEFANSSVADFNIEFNVLSFDYAPNAMPDMSLQEIKLENGKDYVGFFRNGRPYKFVGTDVEKYSDWYYDPDFFVPQGDGTFKFNAVSGDYTIRPIVKATTHGFKVWAMNGNIPASLNDDGTGALWIIGSQALNKPSYMYGFEFNSGWGGWWTDIDLVMCMAQVRSKVYQFTATVGKQLANRPDGITFKFFGQAGWGVELNPTKGYNITTDSKVFVIGDGTTEYRAGKDAGNVYVNNGVTLVDGETYVFTVDLTAGAKNAKMTVEKK